jgi:hypothetical protein
MKGRIIDIATALRPNPDGTCDGVITMKSDSNANCFDVLAWKTDSQPTKAEAMGAIISHVETMKKDMELCLSILKMEKQKIDNEL